MKYHVTFDIDFQRNTYGGQYIVVEGIDGSGKTTQVANIAAQFQKQGKEVVVTGEPRKDKGIFGKLIQEILLSKKKIPSVAFQYLFSADRAVHQEELIIPSLKEGKIVLSDRCFWSAVPYGIMDHMMGKGQKDYSFEMGKVILTAQSVLSFYHQFLLPDKTLYLDISLETAMKRIQEGNKEKEIYEDREKLEKIMLGYQWLAKEFPKEITVIDGEKSVEEVTKEIINDLRS